MTPSNNGGTVNDIDTAALQASAVEVTADQESGLAEFSVCTEWLGGTRARAHVERLTLGSTAYPRSFTVDSDEPPELLGGDTAPNPQELLLAALNACLTVGIVATAAAQDVRIAHLQLRTSGTLDLRGFLDLDAAVNPGYDRVEMAIDIHSDAPEADVRGVLDKALRISPNLSNFRRAIAVEPKLTIRSE